MTIKGEGNCFITLKDHKENFDNRPTTRLINPAKNELGRISKSILDKINNTIRKSLSLNQWRSTKDVLPWLNGIESKHLCKFMTFDVTDFYPSISESLLVDAITFASKLSAIISHERETICHSRKSLLFNNGESWMIKYSPDKVHQNGGADNAASFGLTLHTICFNIQ